MLNTQGQVIYVGKAKRLRNRLSSYFQNGRKDWKTQALVNDIAGVEVVLVNNEIESLVLENNLIKLYRPPYNRMLMRDDTGYSYIVLTDEVYQRFSPFKKHWINKNLGDANTDTRYGPYPNKNFRDSLLDFVSDYYRVRTCNPLPKRVCLRYHLGTCSGICEKFISSEDYQQAVDQAVAFLKHKNTAVLREMRQELSRCSEALEYERAQRIKMQLDALTSALESQIVERDVTYDQDVLYFGKDYLLVMRINLGTFLAQKVYRLDLGEDGDRSRLAFLRELYKDHCPDELITNLGVEMDDLEVYLRNVRGKKVRIIRPQRGIKRRLLALSKKNFDYQMAGM